MEKSDAEFMMRLVNTPGWLQYIGDRNIHTLDEATAYIEKIHHTPKFYYSVIEKTDSAEAIGILSFIYRQNYDFPDFGFALLPEFQKAGYAAEASNAYLQELVTQEPRILAITKEGNTSSISLLRKLGFTFYSKDIEGTDNIFIYSSNPE